MSKDKFNKEILDVANTYKEITGKDMPKFFRPPMGKFSEESLKMTKDLGYSSIFGALLMWIGIMIRQPTDLISQKIKFISRTHPGAIALLRF